MPVMDGYQVLAIVMKGKAMAADMLPVICISSEASEEIASVGFMGLEQVITSRPFDGNDGLFIVLKVRLRCI